MQTKTIKNVISNKMEEWLSTINDPLLAEAVKDNLVVSGGCIASMLLKETVNDFDVYIQNIDVLKKLATYYTVGFEKNIQVLDGRKDAIDKKDDEDSYNAKSILLQNLKKDQISLLILNNTNGGVLKVEGIEAEEKSYKPVFFSPNAISLSDNLQIVLRFHGTVEEIHSTFDFIHATNYFTFKEGLVLNQKALESLLTKQLKYQGSYYPLTSIIRSVKFVKRGFHINAGELLKIMYQISDLDLQNINVLYDQLIGVDVAYFEMVIDILKNKRASDAHFKLTQEYLSAIIDRVFDV